MSTSVALELPAGVKSAIMPVRTLATPEMVLDCATDNPGHGKDPGAVREGLPGPFWSDREVNLGSGQGDRAGVPGEAFRETGGLAGGYAGPT